MKICRLFIPGILLIIVLNPSAAQFSGMGGGFEPDSSKKVKIAALPIVNYDPSIGFIAGAIGMGFYRLNQEDTISPPSVTGAMGIYTSNDTWGLIGFQQFYMAEDRWRSTIALGRADVNFQIFVELLPPAGSFVNYKTIAAFAYLKGQRAVIPDLFLGIHYLYLRANTKFEIPNFPVETGFQGFHGLGLNAEYDSRDNVNNPSEGWNISLDVTFYDEALGSESTYQNYEFSANKYVQISEKGILASRFHLASSNGDVPFVGQNVVMGTDIRGYTNGKHRANQVIALQAEYRWTFYKKFGAVFFAGLASAVDRLSDLSFDGLLPALGTGIRYMAIPSEQINVGIDVAIGKEDWGIYFNITEAF
jgi:outer membrane protein assembly factor BamA